MYGMTKDQFISWCINWEKMPEKEAIEFANKVY